jgi:hypothetical protein
MIPEPVRRLADERRSARAVRDFATADRLREEIRRSGFEVIDTSDGFDLRPTATESPAPAVGYASSDLVPSVLDAPPRFDVSVQWVVEGWPQDVQRGIASFRRECRSVRMQHVVVDASGSPEEWPDGVEVIRFLPKGAWAAARNAGLRRSAGRIVVLLDGSVEARGDALSPLLEALSDPTCGITGPFGIVTADLHEFTESPGPLVDAIESYLMAFPRDLLRRGVRFDERFRFYRSADIDLSFQVKALGLDAVVTDVPVERHEHRMWTNTGEGQRARLSKRNFYRFLERWRDRTDLIVKGSTEREERHQ